MIHDIRDADHALETLREIARWSPGPLMHYNTPVFALEPGLDLNDVPVVLSMQHMYFDS